MPISVKIFKPAKTATQSGLAKDYWQLSFDQEKSRYYYHLMGWPGLEEDTLQQLSLRFPTLIQAKRFAEKNNWQYRIVKAQQKPLFKKSYADNFK